ncbi:putative meiosis specific protein Hop1 [Aspergillus stella-maris]|uniref:putative meiosis specific protein Hop1 n=1 Tax=Aspergillus stella-maris TaxID=1810926 RepID=UPI003CCD53D1
MARVKNTGPMAAAANWPQFPQSRPGASLPSESTAPVSSPPVQNQIRPAKDDKVEPTPEETRVRQQQQSLDLVKIMLHVSFGTLFYLREFLPLQCFDDRDLKEAQRQQSLTYREFIDNKSKTDGSNGVSADNAFGKGKRGQPLKILLRGSEPKADMIINALETGIFDALSKSVLEAVQLTIIADKEAPDNVLESYTFSFRYSEGLGNLHKRLESLSIQPCGYVADMKSAQTARVGLETIVRRLITLSSFLPTLPNKRTLGVHLFYTEDCPPEYEPPGFNGARDGTISYPLTENWIRESQTCGQMESGWHTVGLKVTSLKWIGPEPEASDPIPQIPADIEYKDAVPRTEDIEFDDAESQLQASQNEVRSSQEAAQDVERERLQRIVPVQEKPSSNSEVTSGQSNKPVLANETEDTQVARSGEKFTLRQEKLAEMRKASKLLEPMGFKLKRLQETAPVKCQCDWKGEEDEMIVCSFCHTRQHRLCYGYVGAHESAVPDVHACYRCLLEPDESKILEGMNNIALSRRALDIALNEGVPNSTATFSEKMHCSHAAVSRVKEFLKRKAIMHATPGFKPKESIRRGLPAFIVPDTPQIHKLIQQEIMHPMVRIGHHYTTQYLHTSIETMTPPASQSQSKNTVIPKSSQAEQATHDSSQAQRRTRSSIAHDGALPTPQPSSVRKETPISTRKRTRTSQVGPAIQVPSTPSQTHSTDNEGESEGPRRSGRKKRRKISNYNKLIDVGADTSSENEEA